MSKITKEEFLAAIKLVNDYRLQLEMELKEANEHLIRNSIFRKVSKEDKLMDVTLSSRLRNQLNLYFSKNHISIKWDTHVAVLGIISRGRIKVQRNFGEALLMELEEVCMCAGIKMML